MNSQPLSLVLVLTGPAAPSAEAAAAPEGLCFLLLFFFCMRVHLGAFLSLLNGEGRRAEFWGPGRLKWGGGGTG